MTQHPDLDVRTARTSRAFLARASTLTLAGAFCAVHALAPLANAQGTLDDYRRASAVNARFAGLFTGVVANGVNWVGTTNQFWYRVSVKGGNRYVLGDADAWSKQPAFDHDRLATSLSTAAGAQYTAITLPFNTFNYVNNKQAIEADANNSRWRCTLTDYACTKLGAATDGGGRGGRGGAPANAAGGGRGGFGGRGNDAAASDVRVSPDGKWEATIRNANVAIRAVPTTPARPAGPFGAQAPPAYTQLSFDGAEGDAYQLQSIEWAPDSKKLVAYRRRPGYNRQVHYVASSPLDQEQPKYESTSSLNPNPNTNYRKPGDLLDFNTPVIFDIEGKKQTIVSNAQFQNAYQITRPVWRKDSHAYTFEYNQRGHMVYKVLEVDGTTGAVRAVVDEQTKSFFYYRPASASLSDNGHNFRRDIDDGKEVIWMSERDGWAHLYLYDGATGKVKNQITKGNWLVHSVDSVDVTTRQIYFRALGMNKDQDPYFAHYYRINFDGTGLVTYTEANGTHTVSWSPDHKYYVDSYSRVDMPTVVELRSVAEKKMLPLEKGDMSAAIAAGFRAPEVFVSKARDGVTDIWGIIVRPATFDPNKKYPVIESIYAGPQGSFTPKAWGGGQAFLSTAELGFVVVQLDGMGTNNRSKAFHDVAWKNLADAGFPDRILWHKAVNAKYSWYDIRKVGIYGGSAGGQNAAGAVLFHPEFYTAAFASSGCHDNRMDKIWWNELWMGEVGPHYASNSNVDNAYRLKGKLFLAVGELDINVDPSSTMQVVDALLRSHKEFELLVVPNGGHGATGPDGTRKRNDFFVKSLMGIMPPDWNSGATIAAAGSGATNGNGNGDSFDSLYDGPAYGFFDSPADEKAPYWWW